jgi:hypothetical protein
MAMQPRIMMPDVILLPPLYRRTASTMNRRDALWAARYLLADSWFR